MNGWTDGWMNRWMNKWMNSERIQWMNTTKWMNMSIDKWMKLTNEWIKEQMNQPINQSINQSINQQKRLHYGTWYKQINEEMNVWMVERRWFPKAKWEQFQNTPQRPTQSLFLLKTQNNKLTHECQQTLIVHILCWGYHNWVLAGMQDSGEVCCHVVFKCVDAVQVLSVLLR